MYRASKETECALQALEASRAAVCERLLAANVRLPRTRRRKARDFPTRTGLGGSLEYGPGGRARKDEGAKIDPTTWGILLEGAARVLSEYVPRPVNDLREQIEDEVERLLQSEPNQDVITALTRAKGTILRDIRSGVR